MGVDWLREGGRGFQEIFTLPSVKRPIQPSFWLDLTFIHIEALNSLRKLRYEWSVVHVALMCEQCTLGHTSCRERGRHIYVMKCT